MNQYQSPETENFGGAGTGRNRGGHGPPVLPPPWRRAWSEVLTVSDVDSISHGESAGWPGSSGSVPSMAAWWSLVTLRYIIVIEMVEK